jgi:hypothetical protein
LRGSAATSIPFSKGAISSAVFIEIEHSPVVAVVVTVTVANLAIPASGFKPMTVPAPLSAPATAATTAHVRRPDALPASAKKGEAQTVKMSPKECSLLTHHDSRQCHIETEQPKEWMEGHLCAPGSKLWLLYLSYVGVGALGNPLMGKQSKWETLLSAVFQDAGEGSDVTQAKISARD